MWRNSLLVALVLFAIIPLSVPAQSSAKPNKREARMLAAIRAVLEAQRDAWNRGDIEGYMDAYARSPDTAFVSGDNINRGWQTGMDLYKKNYNTPEKIRTLTFFHLEITFVVNN